MGAKAPKIHGEDLTRLWGIKKKKAEAKAPEGRPASRPRERSDRRDRYHVGFCGALGTRWRSLDFILNNRTVLRRTAT